jgi:hypothetical protein
LTAFKAANLFLSVAEKNTCVPFSEIFVTGGDIKAILIAEGSGVFGVIDFLKSWRFMTPKAPGAVIR